MVNPDGHEWLRAKWSLPVRKYWKFSEQLMVKHADLLVCDSKNIESLYPKRIMPSISPKRPILLMGQIPVSPSYAREDEKVRTWFNEKQVSEGNYYPSGWTIRSRE